MRTLSDWLEFQQRQHPREIALGLDRVREVAQRMALARPAPVVISVAGTNGKGSTVAFLEAILAAAGYRVGAYTSPHLLRYNERVRVAGAEVGDDELVAAFECIEGARGEVPLTYFEYGTLAALVIFSVRAVDVAVLEVGLGGRLDAVNLVDADAAIVTTVDLDHQDWLGDNRAAIAREKAGIFRKGRPAIVGEAEPPPALLDCAQQIGARLERAGHEFSFAVTMERERGWQWSHQDGTRLDLPAPLLQAPAQVANAAAAIAALHALRDRISVTADAHAQGVARASVPGRLQRFPGAVDVVLDVAHNPQAARELAAWLAQTPVAGRTHAVFGALGDKDVAGMTAALAPRVSQWHLAGLQGDTPRGLSAASLRERMGETITTASATAHENVADAYRHAKQRAQPGDRILVFGSFYVVAAALSLLLGT